MGSNGNGLIEFEDLDTRKWIMRVSAIVAIGKTETTFVVWFAMSWVGVNKETAERIEREVRAYAE